MSLLIIFCIYVNNEETRIKSFKSLKKIKEASDLKRNSKLIVSGFISNDEKNEKQEEEESHHYNSNIEELIFFLKQYCNFRQFKENKGKGKYVNTVLSEIFLSKSNKKIIKYDNDDKNIYTDNIKNYDYICICDGDILVSEDFFIKDFIVIKSLLDEEPNIGIVSPEHRGDRRHFHTHYFENKTSSITCIPYLSAPLGFQGVGGAMFFFRTKDLLTSGGWDILYSIETNQSLGPYQPDDYLICSKFFKTLNKITVIIPSIQIYHPYPNNLKDGLEKRDILSKIIEDLQNKKTKIKNLL